MSVLGDPALRPNKGFHPILEEQSPYLFIDGCMQAWPDADFANAHRHGVTAYAVTAIHPHSSLEAALREVMFWDLIARKHSDNLTIANTSADIRSAKQKGIAAIIVAAQDGDWIGRELHRVEALHRLGLRMMLPVYNATNQIGGGCLDHDTGLTRFGEALVDECQRLGLLLDGSHVGKRTTLDIMARIKHPFVFSHSNARSIVDNPRNVDDEQIRACVATGGVIGLAPFGPFTIKKGSRQQPSLNDFIDHIDHVAQLTGSTDHIGIGTDMSLGTYPYHDKDPWPQPKYADAVGVYAEAVSGDVRSPKRALRDFNTFSQVGALVEALKRRGYKESDVEKILGGNFLRVFEQVWG